MTGSRNMPTYISGNIFGESDWISRINTGNINKSAGRKITTVPLEPAALPKEPEVIQKKPMDIPGKLITAPDIAVTVPDITIIIPDESVSIPDTSQEPPIEETVNQNFLCNGFICDSSGKITGCQDISITDGVLCLPSDSRCTGIAAGALSSFGMQVSEIYIPANITTIDEEAFDGLTELFFIEIHPDNPVYGSSEGFLYKK